MERRSVARRVRLGARVSRGGVMATPLDSSKHSPGWRPRRGDGRLASERWSFAYGAHVLMHRSGRLLTTATHGGRTGGADNLRPELGCRASQSGRADRLLDALGTHRYESPLPGFKRKRGSWAVRHVSRLSANHETAVDDKGLTRDICRVGACQEGHGARDLVGRPHSTHERPRGRTLEQIPGLQPLSENTHDGIQLLLKGRIDDPGQHCVDPNAPRSQSAG